MGPDINFTESEEKRDSLLLKIRIFKGKDVTFGNIHEKCKKPTKEPIITGHICSTEWIKWAITNFQTFKTLEVGVSRSSLELGYIPEDG